ncbi:alcohol dehydrogenase [Trichoderma harzianum]|uniref:Alcohol dehydrogenase n=1 Tax=Trichoderma harzianum TaxID=5544 RepID=A0A0F9XY03_TRIHA|nr:alcohol dehydrogenase [Trichoderma harzianum]
MSETYEQYMVDLDGVFGDSEEPFPTIKKVKVEARPLPLEPGYVRVRLRAATVNWRVFIVVENPPLYIPTHQVFVPLSDGAGEIVEISSKGSLWSVGERVITVPNCGWKQGYDVADFDPVSSYGSSNIDGTLSKFMIVRDDGIVKAPSNVSWEEAVCLPVAGGSAWNALFHGPTPVKPGGLSTFAIQLQQLAGRSFPRLLRMISWKWPKDLGATYTINYTKHTKWSEKGLEFTGNRGVDHVVDVIGLPTAAEAVRSLRTGGQVTFIGFLGGQAPPPDLVNTLLAGGKAGMLAASKPMIEELVRAVEMNNIHPQIGQVFDWNEDRKAYAALASGSVVGKVVIRI